MLAGTDPSIIGRKRLPALCLGLRIGPGQPAIVPESAGDDHEFFKVPAFAQIERLSAHLPQFHRMPNTNIKLFGGVMANRIVELFLGSVRLSLIVRFWSIPQVRGLREVTASMRGVVTDATGAIVPHAQVSADPYGDRVDP